MSKLTAGQVKKVPSAERVLDDEPYGEYFQMWTTDGYHWQFRVFA